MKHVETIEQLLSLIDELNYMDDPELREATKKEIEILEEKIAHNIDFFDDLVLNYEIEIEKIEGIKKVIAEELNSLNKKQKALNILYNRIKELMLETVKSTGKINRNGNRFVKTNRHTYTVIKRNRVEIRDMDSIPDEYIVINKTVDKRSLYSDLSIGDKIIEGVELVPYHVLMKR